MSRYRRVEDRRDMAAQINFFLSTADKIREALRHGAEINDRSFCSPRYQGASERIGTHGYSALGQIKVRGRNADSDHLLR